MRFDFHTPEALADIRAAYEKFLLEAGTLVRRGKEFKFADILTSVVQPDPAQAPAASAGAEKPKT